MLDPLSTENFISLDEQITVFPNPSNRNITIKNSNIAINEIKISNVNLDLSSILSSGLYFIIISTGDVSVVKKLVIE